METYHLEKDLTIFYVRADAFPQGINKAIETLHANVKNSRERMMYGISRPDQNGVIVYKAGMEEAFAGEGKSLHCERMVLKKGSYRSILVKNYRTHMEEISVAFQKILHEPGIDPEGYCVEVYKDQETVLCMVRLKE